MDIKEAISTVRERIKSLAAIQIKAKRARKTVRIPKEEREALIKELSAGKAWYSPASDVLRRRGEITAHLNYLHELRGSKYEHGIKKLTEDGYDAAREHLRQEFPIPLKTQQNG